MAQKKMQFEEQLKRLQAIVEELERGELPLEKSVELYKEGLTLSKTCRGQLEKARNEITVFSEGAVQPFDGTEENVDDPAGA